MNSISMNFANPWFLLLLIPLYFITLFPYFRLPKKHRRTRNRIVSMVLHFVIVTMIVFIISGLTFSANEVNIKNDVAIVVDKSKSTENIKGAIDERVEGVLKEAKTNNDYRIGIVTFANGSVYSSGLSTDIDKVWNDYITGKNELDLTATDIGGAISFAQTLFVDNPSGGRIILISDGRETDGKAIAAASAAASLGTRVDTIYIQGIRQNGEAQINSVVLPEYIAIGTNFQITITVESISETGAVLRVYDNDTIIGEASGSTVNLSGGTDTFVIDHSFISGGLHKIKAVIEPQAKNETNKDIIAENNTYYTFVNIDGGEQRMLIIEGSTDESKTLAPFLRDEYEVDVTNLTELTKNMNMIYNYDEIIMMNCSNKNLPTGFDQILDDYVKTTGGGLLTVGGNNAYQEDDMKDSIFEAMQPVYSNTDAKPLAVALVIDASTSMINNGNRAALAKQGAKAAVDAMADNSLVGVIQYNSAAKQLIGMTPMGARDEIKTAIDRISNSIGTHYSTGLNMARNTLNTFEGHENYNKHIIFLTDGGYSEASPDAFMSIINTLGDISLTTIGLGNTDGINKGVLESMVHEVNGRGNNYMVTQESQLPSIMRTEAEAVSSAYLNVEKFTPELKTKIPSLALLTSVPDLEGYYGTRPKEGSTVVLAKESDPIYSEWKYGNGKVGSFMSDLTGNWSSAFFNDNRGKVFINGMVKSLLPERSIVSQGIDTTLSYQNYQATLKITSLGSNKEMFAQVTSPSGSITTIDLTKQTDYVFGGLFNTKEPGIYSIYIRKTSASGEVTETITYAAFSYSQEFNHFYSEIDAKTLMTSIAEYGKGELLKTTLDMFSLQAQTFTVVHDPRLGFLIAALVLFLLDIVARKFKFKWPHELINKHKENQNLNS